MDSESKNEDFEESEIRNLVREFFKVKNPPKWMKSAVRKLGKIPTLDLDWESENPSRILHFFSLNGQIPDFPGIWTVLASGLSSPGDSLTRKRANYVMKKIIFIDNQTDTVQHGKGIVKHSFL